MLKNVFCPEMFQVNDSFINLSMHIAPNTKDCITCVLDGAVASLWQPCLNWDQWALPSPHVLKLCFLPLLHTNHNVVPLNTASFAESWTAEVLRRSPILSWLRIMFFNRRLLPIVIAFVTFKIISLSAQIVAQVTIECQDSAGNYFGYSWIG